VIGDSLKRNAESDRIDQRRTSSEPAESLSRLRSRAYRLLFATWWGAYWPFVRRIKLRASTSIILTITSAASEAIGLATLGRAAFQQYDAIVYAMAVTSVIAGSIVLSAVAKAGAERQMAEAQVALETSLRGDVTDAILRCEWQDFVDQPGHELQSAAISEAPQVGQATLTLVRAGASIAGALVVFSSTFVVSLPAAAVCTIFGAVIAYVYSRSVRGLREVQTMLAEGNAEITRQTMVLVNGLKTLRLSPIQSEWRSDLQTLFGRYADARRADLSIPIRGRLLVEALSGIMILAVLVIQVAYSGTILPGLIVMALILRVIPRVQTAQQLLAFAKYGSTWIDRWQRRLGALNVEESHRPAPPQNEPVPDSRRNLPPRPPPSVLRLRHVHFAYRGHVAPVLTDVSLYMRQGEWLSLRGSSGQGKSTLVDLIGGLLVPTRGEIILQGVPIESYDRRRLYETLVVVPQDIHLIGSSVKEVVTWGERLTPKTQMSLITSTLGIDGMFLFSENSNGKIDEMSRDISGGMRTRLAMARALASSPAVLILDETTSRLHPDAEAEVFAAVRRLRPDLAVVVVTHREETTVHVDRKLRLSKGQLEEE
jgi:ABC-type multidrug transport system fused ATPase/permease subunit